MLDTAAFTAVLTPLVFFRIFGRALSREDICRWQGAPAPGKVPCTPEEVETLLAQVPGVVRRGDLYLLSGDGEGVNVDPQRSDAYLLHAKRHLGLLRWIPGVRSVAVVNTVAFGAADEESDIDLFIIARSGFLWWVRLVSTLLLHVRGVRRHGSKVAGRFCLSFFVDEEALDLRAIALEEDVYLAYWMVTMIPLVGQETFDRFVAVNRPFALQTCAGWVALPTVYPRAGIPFVEGLLLTVGAPLLLAVRWLQRAKMRHFPVKIGPGADVVVNDHMLKFHNKDRRTQFRDQLRREVDQLLTTLS